MLDFKQLVNEFQKGVNLRSSKIYDSEKELIELKIKLLSEEYYELKEALRFGTKAEMLKEVCDVLYIAFGIAATYDLPIEDAFMEVHRNNMLKLDYPIVDGKVIKTKDHPICDLTYLVE